MVQPVSYTYIFLAEISIVFNLHWKIYIYMHPFLSFILNTSDILYIIAVTFTKEIIYY